MTGDRRSRGLFSGVRRDINDLTRDEGGKVSLAKVGTMIGMFLAAKIIFENGRSLTLDWDLMTILFVVLIAPELFKKAMHMKYGLGHNGNGDSHTVVKQTTTEKTTTKEVKQDGQS